MSQIIQSYNQEIQNSLTRRIILYLRKLLFLKFLTTSNIASMIIACQRKMKNANIVVQPLCLKMSQIIEYSNQESQNSLTQRIVPQLHFLRKLSFHEAEKFIFTILKLLTPLNIASMIIACQRKKTPANSNQGNQNSLTQRIIPQLCCLRKLSFHQTEKFIFTILKLQTPSYIASMIIACQRKMTPANTLFLNLWV